jgi:FkbM family methyltransferase
MKAFEKISMRIRHAPILEHADWLWNPLRPIYERTLRYFWGNGIERIVNGSDRILISSKAREVSENYEPDVWKAVMSELRAGDTFVDVGAFIGLYTIAAAARYRGSGRVVAFEPDVRNFSLLQEHIRLNRLEGQVELHRTAVSDRTGLASFLANGRPKLTWLQVNRAIQRGSKSSHWTRCSLEIALTFSRLTWRATRRWYCAVLMTFYARRSADRGLSLSKFILTLGNRWARTANPS